MATPIRSFYRRRSVIHHYVGRGGINNRFACVSSQYVTWV